MDNVDRNDFQEKHGGLGAEPPENFDVKNDFAIHEFTPENPVTFQKSRVAGGEGVKPLCTMGK